MARQREKLKESNSLRKCFSNPFKGVFRIIIGGDKEKVL